MFELIDTHCHLDKFLEGRILGNILDEAKAMGVTQMIGVATHAKDWRIYQSLAEKYKDKIHYSIGLHPCCVEEDWEDQLEQLMPYFADEIIPVAIGEIGLDYHHLPENPAESENVKRLREEAFRQQLAYALQLDCPIIVHSRNCFHETVRIIDESGVNWKRVVFHCFSEGGDEVDILNLRGGRASFTGIVTYKNAENVREAVRRQGIDKIMIETDSPYLAPMPFRGKDNHPGYVRLVAEKCAEILNIQFKSFAYKVTENSQKFFGLK